MKKEDKRTIKIKLHKAFTTKIREEMEDEMEEAIDKWGLDLTEEEKDNIVDHSFNQLIHKVSENARIDWDLGDEIEIKVNGIPGNVTLPTENQKFKKLELIKTRVGWEVSTEEEIPSIKMNDFKNHYEDLIISWARTGIFYGVGSYAS